MTLYHDSRTVDLTAMGECSNLKRGTQDSFSYEYNCELRILIESI